MIIPHTPVYITRILIRNGLTKINRSDEIENIDVNRSVYSNTNMDLGSTK